MKAGPCVAQLARALCAAALLPVAVAHGQDAPDFSRLAEFIRWGGVILSVPVVVGGLVLIRVVENVITPLSVRFANRRPTLQKVQSVLHFGVYLTMVAVCISLSVRLDPTALTVIGGALAFAVGFAMRDLVAAFIAGLTIMFDRPFQVGDRVEYAGQYGDIIKIGLRSIRMLTLNHTVVTIPNNKVLTDVIWSANYGELETQVALDFYIALDQDVRLAMELVREACLNSQYVFLKEPVPVFAKQVLEQNILAVRIRARPYVFDCKHDQDFESDVHLRVLEAFRAHGIGAPAILHQPRTDERDATPGEQGIRARPGRTA